MSRSLRLLLLLLALAPAALADPPRTFDLEGQADGLGPFSGAVELHGEDHDVQVVQRLTFVRTGETRTLAGRGRLQAGRLVAELRPAAGAAQALDRLGADRPDAPATRLQLRLEEGGARWSSRCEGAAGTAT